jgi:alkylation response protein AidB-like acyl-CoA dehydrogenase
MEVTLTDDQAEFQSVLRRFFAEKYPIDEVRRLIDSGEGFEPALWQEMAEQMGLIGLMMPEEYGGSGQGLREICVVLEEMGRCLYSGPYMSTAVLTPALLLCLGDKTAMQEVFPELAAGVKIATVALDEGSAPVLNAGDINLAATRDKGNWSLTGEKAYVLDATVADLFFVPARTESGISIFCVEKGADGLTTTGLSTMDLARNLGRVCFNQTPARLIGEVGSADAALEKFLDLAAVALGAEQLGGAARVLDMAVEYAKLRFQFGRPIGSFQAIKHRCSEMLVKTESARSAVYYASWAAEQKPAEFPVLASLVKAYCSQMYLESTISNIQIHGGIGFTWEYPAHLYYRRAQGSEIMYGPAEHHREALLERMGV